MPDYYSILKAILIIVAIITVAIFIIIIITIVATAIIIIIARLNSSFISKIIKFE
jgi:hypothetical protein